MVLQATGKCPGSPECLAHLLPTLETQMTTQPLWQTLSAASHKTGRHW